jgi:hypothetical protein
MKTKDNITYDTLVSQEVIDTGIVQKEQPFLFYSSETFRTVLHPETGDTFFIDGVHKPVPLDKEMEMESDFILPCDLPEIGNTAKAETFIEIPAKKDYSIKEVDVDPFLYLDLSVFILTILIIPSAHIVLSDVIKEFKDKLVGIWKRGEYC